jgi:hypothetical protein
MAPAPSKIGPVLVPGTEWVTYQLIDDFSIRSVDQNGDEDLIHFCDWPALRATIDQFMADRAKEAEG